MKKELSIAEEAFLYHDRKWPKHFTGGVMLFKGFKISQYDFEKYGKVKA